MGSLLPKAEKAFPPGVHVPSLTWFKDDTKQEIDWALQKRHLQFLVQSALHGVVLAGTNGEAVTLTSSEKARLIQLTREIGNEAGRRDLPITAGCGGQCTRDVIAETNVAADAGADFALVLTPSYFHFAMDQDAIVAFFQEVADSSPLPVVIYNFPGVAAGLDVDSPMLEVLGQHPNIVGVKLTCGGIAKVARIRASFMPEKFCALAGQSDWLVPALAVGGVGVITGVANLFPKYCLHIYESYTAGKTKEAEAAQLKLAQMELGFAKGGINGSKFATAKLLGYPIESSHCRRPYPRYSDADTQAWILDTCTLLVKDERSLSTNT